MKVKKVIEKVGLKLKIQKTKIMISGPVTSGQVDGETMETGIKFILGAPKPLKVVTVVMKLKDTLSLGGGGNYTNLDSKIKSRDITLPTKSS